MVARYPVLGLFLFLGLAASAQTVLTETEYDQRKAAGTLPGHPVLVADPATKSLKPAHPGMPKGGGGPCGCWVQPDASYTLAMAPNDDMSSAAIALPFSFSLFGDSYDTLFINNNGNLSFDAPWGTFSASGFPSPYYKMVAPFWGDVDTRAVNGGEVWYKLTPTALYVNWVNVGYYAMRTDKLNSFQVILTDGTDPAVPGGNNVSFCYLDMQWTTGEASGGINGFGGVPATVGVNRGDSTSHAQVGRFAWDDTTYGGAYADTSGISWLDSTHFYLNTTNAGIPPIIGSGFACDSIVVQVNAGSSHQMVVIAGAPGQQVSCTSICPSIASYQQAPTLPGEQVNVLFSLNPDASEIGQHLITFTAVNDDPVPLISTYQVLVEVVPGLSTGLGEVPATGFDITPNPAVDQAVIQLAPSADLRTMRFVDAQGRRVLDLPIQAGSDHLRVDLSSLAQGAYLVVAEGPGQRAIQRLMVTR